MTLQHSEDLATVTAVAAKASDVQLHLIQQQSQIMSVAFATAQ